MQSNPVWWPAPFNLYAEEIRKTYYLSLAEGQIGLMFLGTPLFPVLRCATEGGAQIIGPPVHRCEANGKATVHDLLGHLIDHSCWPLCPQPPNRSVAAAPIPASYTPSIRG